ncbi:hypothetical protein B0T22DRAFT_374273 [Podospora appendiculata]|uniref:DUF1917-domain-containing protein n=1 Tax=Podospora appendiculata TaxID=314037 RepID=A0AAE1CGH9_9PEZI|nr:hypothetical protein B0T22DRAFT_374273 [Podospora appendiculata]
MPDATPPPSSPQGTDDRLPGESVAQFLSRLPPVVPPDEEQDPTRPDWFWIRPPSYTPTPATSREIIKDAVERFTAQGQALLREFSLAIEKWPRSPPMQKRLRARLESDIASAAKGWNLTAGKWLIHAPPKTLPSIWRRVAEGIQADTLGPGAKVSTKRFANTGRDEQVICVYTTDFTDVPDVKRVLVALAEIGVVGKQRVKYKCDAYTYLGIYSQRAGVGWSGLRATIYDSCDEGFLGRGSSLGGVAGRDGRGKGDGGDGDGDGDDGGGWQVVRRRK